MEYKCEKCGFISKSKSGLGLHMVKHRNEQLEPVEPIEPVEPPNVLEPIELVEPEEKAYNEENLPFARIRLFRPTAELVISYPVHSREEIEMAKENALKKGFKIKIS